MLKKMVLTSRIAVFIQLKHQIDKITSMSTGNLLFKLLFKADSLLLFSQTRGSKSSYNKQ